MALEYYFTCPPTDHTLYFVTMNKDMITLLAGKLLTTTRQLALGPNTYKSLFARVVEGTFRRDYLTLYTMAYLARHGEPEELRAFGSSCMDLSRRVLEDLIALEYMLYQGKEAHAKKFFDYYHIEAKQDLDFLEAGGVTIDQQFKATVGENYNRVKRRFLDSSSKAKRKGWSELAEFLKSQGKIDEQTEQQIEEEANRRYSDASEQPRRAWAGLDTEAMVETLVHGRVINADEQRIIIESYTQGNRKNHFSPTDVSAFLYNDLYNVTSEGDLILSLIATTTGVTRIARIFADEFDIPEETKRAIDEVWQTIFTAHLSEED